VSTGQEKPEKPENSKNLKNWARKQENGKVFPWTARKIENFHIFCSPFPFLSFLEIDKRKIIFNEKSAPAIQSFIICFYFLT
jgi:hypothetical protein